MELEKGEIIDIPLEKYTNFTNAKRPEIEIIILSFSVVLLGLAIHFKNQH